MGDLAARVPIPIVVIEQDGTVVRANDAAVDDFGDAVEPIADLGESVAEQSIEAFSRLLDADRETTVSLGIVVDDEITQYPVTATPIEDGIELVFDTTITNERYASLVDNISDPIYVLDVDGVVQMVNDAFADEYGWPKEEIVGKHVSEFMPDDAVDRGRAKIGELLETGAETARLEFQGADADDRERWTEVRITVRRDETGAFAGSVGVFRDITDRKQRERELAAFETIAETAPVGIFTVDEEGTLTWANRQFYDQLGVTSEDVLDRPFLDLLQAGLVEPEMLERYSDYVRTLLSSDEDVDRVQHEEVLHPPAEDDPVIVDAYSALLPLDEDDRFTGTVNAFRDITQRKAYREALERQNERLEAFASLVSHDLRNPLNVASGYLELAHEQHPDDDALAEIAYSLDRMDELIEDLLTLARQGDAVGETYLESLEEIAKRAWSTVETTDATLDVQTAARVEADETRLRQLFENLFRNSVEHGRPDDAASLPDAADADESRDAADGGTTTITVTVGATEDGFFVADDGVGLPDDIDLFELGATTNEDGTGLGLAIVSEIVEAHGWEIDAGPGADDGARFDIRGAELVGPEADGNA